MLAAASRERQTRTTTRGAAAILRYNERRMRGSGFVLLAAIVCAQAVPALAQEPPPPIPRIVFDVRGSVPKFTTEPQLAESRGLVVTQLPHRGLGADVGLHVYLFKWKAMTLGLGGQLTLTRGVSSPLGAASQPTVAGVTERFQSITPQLSFNFGDGDGWSYISGGIGPSQRTLVPDGSDLALSDEERLRSVNYGGGARWFIKSHVAFTLDVRLHQIDPGTPVLGFAGSPRSTLLVIGAGVSFK